jgi:hypothetical protein
MDLWCALWFWPGEQIDLAPLPVNFCSPRLKPWRKPRLWPARAGSSIGNWNFRTSLLTSSQVLMPWWVTLRGKFRNRIPRNSFLTTTPLYRAYGQARSLVQAVGILPQPAGAGARLDFLQRGHQGHVELGQVRGSALWRPGHDGQGQQEEARPEPGRTEPRQLFRLCAPAQEVATAARQAQGFSDAAHPFLHQGSADLNTYKMFLEQSHALMRPKGRMGMIVPSGIYTDKGTASLRELFLDHCDWQWLFGFENREKVFDIDSRFKFCPIVLQKGGVTQAIRAAFMHKNVDDWAHAERFVLAYPRERWWNFPPTPRRFWRSEVSRTCKCCKRSMPTASCWVIKVNVVGASSFATEFHMTNDSKLFPPRPKWEEKGYQPGEYGQWLKGPWQPFNGEPSILVRGPDLVMSRDRSEAMRVDEIEGVALPPL